MAESSADKEELLAEQKAVKEATREYDDLVATLILIATSNKSKREKLALINERRSRMLDFNSEFSSRQTEQVYKKFSERALSEAEALISEIDVKKKPLPIQQEEAKNLSEELKIVLNKRLDTLIDQAKQLTIKEELQRIRQQKLGIQSSSERLQITPKKSVQNLVFTNSKGQVVSMEAVMKLAVGDQLWSIVTSSQRTEWLLLGFRYVIHISVIDDHTTLICEKLNRTRRDLKKDPLPPMHGWCRSRVKLSKEGWSREIFTQNFGKK